MITYQSHKRAALFAVVAALSLTSSVMDAAPSLEITRRLTRLPTEVYTGPLWPQYAGTGPRFDPHASAGMWFLDPRANTVSSRSRELHDEPIGNAPLPSAIYGRVSTFERNISGTRMISFTLDVIIANKTFNSTSTVYQYYGTNVQGERRRNSVINAVQVNSPVLTLEFVSPAGSNGRYVAEKQDLLAFYNGNSTDKNLGYYVPAWRFGNLAVGQQTAPKSIKIFLNVVGGVAQGIDINGEEAKAIIKFRGSNIDLLGNPAGALKIARYPVAWSPSTLWTSTNYIPNNASVFHNP